MHGVLCDRAQEGLQRVLPGIVRYHMAIRRCTMLGVLCDGAQESLLRVLPGIVRYHLINIDQTMLVAREQDIIY